MSESVFTLHQGTRPLLLSLPHVGTVVPDDLHDAFVPRALAVEDTDWHLEAVYDFARGLGASVLVPRHSRYVVDLNRPPENTPMYAGANNTELVPTRFFTGEPLYRDGRVPDAAEVGRRLDAYWRPYHDALQGELARLVAAHGHAVLWDGHSIQDELPWLFDGRLPELNLGTASGASCAASLRDALMGVLAAQGDFSHVTDGRFKGGYITRRYGRPADGVHAVQMEKCWSCYLRAGTDGSARPGAATTADAGVPPDAGRNAPGGIDAARLARLQPLLRRLFEASLAWRPDAA